MDEGMDENGGPDANEEAAWDNDISPVKLESVEVVEQRK